MLEIPSSCSDKVVPTLLPVATPSPLIFATDVSEEDQFTVWERSWVLASVYVPIAVNCWVTPLADEGWFGVTATHTVLGSVTVNVAAWLVMPSSIAVICGDPVPTPAAGSGAAERQQ